MNCLKCFFLIYLLAIGSCGPVAGHTTYHILKEEEIEDILERIKPKIVIPKHYKISELEPTPNVPKNLGPIEEYFRDMDNVVRLKNNVTELGNEELPSEMQFLVFRHSPKVKN